MGRVRLRGYGLVLGLWRSSFSSAKIWDLHLWDHHFHQRKFEICTCEIVIFTSENVRCALVRSSFSPTKIWDLYLWDRHFSSAKIRDLNLCDLHFHQWKLEGMGVWSWDCAWGSGVGMGVWGKPSLNESQIPYPPTERNPVSPPSAEVYLVFTECGLFTICTHFATKSPDRWIIGRAMARWKALEL